MKQNKVLVAYMTPPGLEREESLVLLSGREIVSELDESESTVQTLSLLLETPACRSRALLVLLLVFLSFIRRKEI